MRWIVAGLWRSLLLALLWLLLSGAESDYLAYGAASVAAASLLSLGLIPPQGPPRPARWPRRLWFGLLLAGWFLGQSAAGGVDVARRALGRRPDIEPAVVRAPVDLPEGHARQLAMLLMNLMPGSMIQRAPGSTGHDAAASAGGDQVELHTLSVSLDPAGQWSRLQRRVAQAAR